MSRGQTGLPAFFPLAAENKEYAFQKSHTCHS